MFSLFENALEYLFQNLLGNLTEYPISTKQFQSVIFVYKGGFITMICKFQQNENSTFTLFM